jgi:hypothetical protein
VSRARPRAGNDNRPPRQSVRAEDLFVAWLLWLPEGVDPRKAALAEIARLDGRKRAGAGEARLRALFAELATGGRRRRPGVEREDRAGL